MCADPATIFERITIRVASHDAGVGRQVPQSGRWKNNIYVPIKSKINLLQWKRCHKVQLHGVDDANKENEAEEHSSHSSEVLLHKMKWKLKLIVVGAVCSVQPVCVCVRV